MSCMPSIRNNVTYHFVVDFVKVDLTDFVHNVFAFKGDKSEASVTIGLFIKHEHGILDLQENISQLCKKIGIG